MLIPWRDTVKHLEAGTTWLSSCQKNCVVPRFKMQSGLILIATLFSTKFSKVQSTSTRVSIGRSVPARSWPRIIVGQTSHGSHLFTAFIAKKNYIFERSFLACFVHERLNLSCFTFNWNEMSIWPGVATVISRIFSWEIDGHRFCVDARLFCR